jgi:hypothetical protein
VKVGDRLRAAIPNVAKLETEVIGWSK